jgi:hypothetical protein
MKRESDILDLLPRKGIAIVPPPLLSLENRATPERWVRPALLATSLGIASVFAVALWLKPYAADGQPLRMETHRQLGLPPCTFYTLTGLPCPSCGMTTSFALFVRGDFGNSLRANAVGTLLAAFCIVLLAWSGIGLFYGRWLLVSPERLLIRSIVVFLTLLLVRWIIIVGLRTGLF